MYRGNGESSILFISLIKLVEEQINKRLYVTDLFIYVLHTFLNVVKAGNHLDAVGYG